MATLKSFVRNNRKEIDDHIEKALGGAEKHRFRNDEERRLWVLSDESLYLWSRREGVKEE